MVEPDDVRALGANLPWFRYGCDFGANAWQPRGGLADRGVTPDHRRALEEAAGCGVRVIRWFLLCDGRAGVRFDGDRPAGLDDRVFRDVDAALDLAEAVGVRVVFVLFDFHWGQAARVENGVQLGGRRSSLVHKDARQTLIDTVAAPLFARYGSHRAIAAWDLFNEPEWITWRCGAINPLSSVRPGAMRALIAGLATRARPLVRQPLTVGLASAKWLSLVEGLDLDFYQVHWYDRVEDGRLPGDVGELGLDRPVVLGEFPTAGSAHAPEAIAAHAAHAGYAAAWPWSILAGDGATDGAAAARTFDAERVARLARIHGVDRPRETEETPA